MYRVIIEATEGGGVASKLVLPKGFGELYWVVWVDIMNAQSGREFICLSLLTANMLE
jgi:hypothetical protein